MIGARGNSKSEEPLLPVVNIAIKVSVQVLELTKSSVFNQVLISG